MATAARARDRITVTIGHRLDARVRVARTRPITGPTLNRADSDAGAAGSEGRRGSSLIAAALLPLYWPSRARSPVAFRASLAPAIRLRPATAHRGGHRPHRVPDPSHRSGRDRGGVP